MPDAPTFDGDDIDSGPLPPQWDDDDPRRQLDPMAPPAEPCECHCIECGRRFPSAAIWFQPILNDPAGHQDGFWMCPTPNCGGAGFTFDIFPVDPDHPANAGWFGGDDVEDGIEFDDDGSGDDAEYDPAEPRYAALDAEAVEEGDFEGEEWKHGLSPDAWLAASADDERGGLTSAGDADDGGSDGPAAYDLVPWEDADEAALDAAVEARETRFDAPDERPRSVEWSDLPSSRPRSDADGEDDDIPF